MTERDKDIFNRLDEHWMESLDTFSYDQIVGLFLQGSQNYELDTPDSDIDTKLIVAPTFREIALNRQPVSTTHIRANNEHIDFKDIRLYMNTFRKQNLNFLEILFTDYFIIPSAYYSTWMKLVERREEIARMNPYRAVKSMAGIAKEKYHAMEHRYPSKIDIIDKFGYDPKQVSHLVRVRDYLDRYVEGELYEKCLRPSGEFFDLIMNLKLGKFSLAEARIIAEEHLFHINKVSEEFYKKNEDKENLEMTDLLEEICYEIMKIAVENELGKTGSS